LRRLAFAFLACLLAISASAQTIPGSPKAKAPTAPAERGAQNQSAPAPPIIVNVVPAPKSDEEKQEERRERAEKAVSDKALVDLTGELAQFTKVLAYATIALACLTAGLFYVGVRQSIDMKESLRIAGQSADAARLSAEATNKQFLISAEQTDIALKAHGLSRLQFLATHGPQILIKRLHLASALVPGKNVQVTMTLINVGSGDARFRIAEASVYFRLYAPPALIGGSTSPWTFDEYDSSIEIIDYRLEPGRSIKIPIKSKEAYPSQDAVPVNTYVAARFAYADDSGRVRETATLRQFIRELGRFNGLPDPDYEYET
jgi:hypothetical protein